jgi:hypothetical protein
LKTTKPDPVPFIGYLKRMAEMNSIISDKIEITEVINRLFVYTDNRQWESLKSSVFTSMVNLDMTSMGAEGPVRISAEAICRMWDEGFRDLDAIHHQAGNYLIDVRKDEATAVAYSIASHYKASSENGKTRIFVGNYDLHLIRLASGWRIDELIYHLKYTEGNLSLD